MTRRAPTLSLPPEVHSEGGLLSADFLQRLGAGDKSITSIGAEAYHLAGRDTLADAMTRAWNELRGHWQSFAARREQDPTAVGRTKDILTHWLCPLFQVLGFGRLAPVPAPLVAGDSTYPISHLWQRVPLHLVAWDQSLDSPQPRMTPRRSPHGLMQDFLNKSDQHLWGVITNGRLLRLMRDHRSLTRQAYVELDLEQMFAGEQFHAFRFLWLLLHESRFSSEHGDTPEQFRLESWFKEAKDEGVRALDKLRDGVTEAIELLGRGFLSAPSNHELRSQLADHQLAGQDFYRELLRLAYRLIFLFVAEDRDALLVPGDDAARKRYERFYSSQHLRRRALESSGRGDAHEDLWQRLRLIMEHLDEGYEPLALPGLGSFLWSKTAAPHVMSAALANQDLLVAVRALASTRDAKGLRHAVSWRLIGADELGGIYESLLELHPRIGDAGNTFELVTAAGHERKTTGSYYTPSALVECLLDSALEPVMAEAIKGKSPEEAESAILSLTVVDPAVGSGHFIRAAGRRLAKKLAQVRSGNDEPDPPSMRRALRDVVGKCLFGVDLNPMAAELCKVALWLEALEPGRPLNFLDSHIQVGNALLGATPELVAKGIPDAAWEPLTGDDKAVSKALKKRNKLGAAGQLDLGVGASLTPTMVDVRLVERARLVETMRQHTRAELGRVEGEWAAYLVSEELRAKTLLADVWCAAFVWPKQTGEANDAAPVDGLFRRFANEPFRFPEPTRKIARSIAEQYGFFHWHLRFPTVMASGGFDVVLGNPPWDTLSPDSKEFFSVFDQSIRAKSKPDQEKIISSLLRDPAVASGWQATCRTIEATADFLKACGRFSLFAPGNLGKGDFNLYRVFVELAIRLTRIGGAIGQIVPDGLYSGANSSAIRQELFESFRIELLLGFENAKQAWFANIDSRAKFVLFSASKGSQTESFRAAFCIRSTSELAAALAGTAMTLSVEMVRRFSPDALAIMEFRNQRDIDIATKMYARFEPLGKRLAGLGHRAFLRELESGHDQEALTEDPDALPHYEGRMVGQYDYRAKGYRSGRARSAVWEDLPFGSASKAVQPQWYVHLDHVPEQAQKRVGKYRVGFCDVGSPTNERTLVASMLPRNCVAGAKVPTIIVESDTPNEDLILWLAAANSFAMDFLVRMKVSLTLAITILDSLPFPRLAASDPAARRIIRAALKLQCTGAEMNGLWDAMASTEIVPSRSEQSVPGTSDISERLSLIALIESEIARLYGFDRDEVEYILDTFPIVRRNDENLYGAYRTKELVLEHFSTRIDAKPTVETSTIPQDAWARPQSDPALQTGALLAATLKTLEGHVSARLVRLRFILAMEPRLLHTYLGAQERDEWIRLVGAEAVPVEASQLQQMRDPAWGKAVSLLKSMGALTEDLDRRTWAAGPALAQFETEGWPDGRAAFVAKHVTIASLNHVLPEKAIQEWIDALAA